MSHIIVVDKKDDFPWEDEHHPVVTAHEYITQAVAIDRKYSKVINLCRSYSYLSAGYYCSLLAEAREDKVIPSARTLLDLSYKATYRASIEVLNELLRKATKTPPSGVNIPFQIMVYFGHTENPLFAEVGRKAFDLFRCPILSITIAHKAHPKIEALKPASLKDMEKEERDVFFSALQRYTRARWVSPRARTGPRFYLAILHNPNDPFCPSNSKALKKFIKAGEALRIDVELIEKKDYLRLAEYDALFIRETTQLDDHTYRFASKAEQEGMPVIDDPASIMRCANKVYLSELLRENKIKTPRTWIIDRKTVDKVESQLTYPIVLKIPDGSFSRGVYKVHSAREFRSAAPGLLRESDVILAQEYMYTDYDWRVGILNGQPLFVCQYFMSKNHWQIVKHSADGTSREGDVRTLRVEDAPQEVVSTALKAARLIGNGLYGVDLKQNDQGVHVIEVNDNPNIDAGIEDAVLKDQLYTIIMEEFIRRVELSRALAEAARPGRAPVLDMLQQVWEEEV